MSSQRSNPNVDRISMLPDSVLCYILSFLPTKCIATTSVLSNRWRQVWLSLASTLTTLDFDDQTFADFTSFRHFVYSVMLPMLPRDTTIPIRSFRLKCGKSSGCDPHDINRFIYATVKRGIENLDLDMSNMNFNVEMRLAHSIFSVMCCRTLVVLKLKKLLIVKDLPHADFPQLKTLHLDNICFNCPYGNFKKLIDGCPILEDLQTNDIGLLNFPKFPLIGSDGESKCLPKLIRADVSISRWNIPFDWVCNAKFLSAQLKLAYNLRVPTFRNLTHMELMFQSNWPRKRKWLVEVLQHCPGLQNLTIHEHCANGYIIDEDDWKDPQIVPECLSSQLRTCSLMDYKGIMLLRDTTIPIRSFRLKCNKSSGCNPLDINLFIYAFVKRGIENLDLDMSGMCVSLEMRLAHSIFSVMCCRTLVVLKLKKLLILKDLPHVDFPQLKTLHLDNIFFVCPYGDFKKLIDGCPILEDLQTNCIRLLQLPLIGSDGESKCLPKLIRANVSISRWNIPFDWVCNAKFISAQLTLTYDLRVPTFHNLTNTELMFWSNWPGKKKWLVEVLQHCPRLQNLTIHEHCRNGYIMDEDHWKDPQIVPECLSSQLRTCSLIDYKGSKCELQFAKYIMQNSKVLHTMTISALLVDDIKIKIQRLILCLCPRASATCKLSFD